MSAIYVQITATRGSAPRDAGTVMKVTQGGFEGTIGGGALEFQAIAKAREMLRSGEAQHSQTIPLGPRLGQCCGGAVSLRFSREASPPDALSQVVHPMCTLRAPMALWIWGAGHVGRAVVAQAAPTRAFDITWIDSAPDRFPADAPEDVTLLPAAEMPRAAALAPRDAHHLILTYSHEIDLALCAALLARGFASCGLIGSATKKGRFAKRLAQMGLDMGPITCPIGDRSLGKHPAMIAAGTIRALRARHPLKETA
ncbi:MAG: xanthine dehydrogenase accessory protein XdhC [Sulfitobacter sp.]